MEEDGNVHNTLDTYIDSCFFGAYRRLYSDGNPNFDASSYRGTD
jgi:hypothetical protein